MSRALPNKALPPPADAGDAPAVPHAPALHYLLGFLVGLLMGTLSVFFLSPAPRPDAAQATHVVTPAAALVDAALHARSGGAVRPSGGLWPAPFAHGAARPATHLVPAVKVPIDPVARPGAAGGAASGQSKGAMMRPVPSLAFPSCA